MFSSFEWGVAFRYLKARRGDKFISVIAGFSLVGICLGVMVLIVVMAVMNGFRTELMDRVLGLNG
ncbi:MAG: lipoprotein-releasing system transmembrane subunit LolC, partial [Proteobacteria bacterium]|nr:lipoprotein-releasing system transmembrane subunit LolC [Pseudomonadota bacterium]